MGRHFVFLVATERSGSNFITSLVNGHPAVSGPPPSHLFRLFVTNRENYGELDNDDHWATLISDFVYAQRRILGRWNTTVDEDELAEVSPRSVGALLRCAYEKEAASDGAATVFVKENQTAGFADYLLRNFDGCRFVFLHRDPRDVARSWADTPSLEGGVEHATRIWMRDQQESLKLYDGLERRGRAFRVSYEELVTDTRHILGRLCEFIGVGYEPAMLEFHHDPRTADNADRIAAWGNLKRPVIEGNTGRYREELSRDDIEYVELVCHRLMERFGYEKDLTRRGEDPETSQERLRELKPRLTVGRYEPPGKDEQRLRRARLEAIDRVLSRRLGP